MKMKRKPRMYFAYGSNLHIHQMAARCPAAEQVMPGKLYDWRLTFRMVADIVPHKGQIVHGALWKITSDCERALDFYEGFPNLYIKKIVHVEVAPGEYVEAMVYIMKQPARKESRPTVGYYGTIVEGFRHWELPLEKLEAAKDAVHLSVYA
jgi:gamma-glutamylcyclotransferase (GGCT)/AIG2-like uncharacterized protein YtfP